VSQKNDTDVAHYNFNAHQPILVIFGRDVADRICYQMMICYLTSRNCCLCSTWGNMYPRNIFSVTVANWVFADMTHIIGYKLNFAWWVASWGSSIVRISSKSIKQFWSRGIEICLFPVIW